MLLPTVLLFCWELRFYDQIWSSVKLKHYAGNKLTKTEGGGGGGGGRNLMNNSWAIDLDDLNFFKLKIIWLK